MKLANLYWMNTEINEKIRAVNFGDILQFKIIDELYHDFFPNCDVVKLALSDVSSYKGENLVLPLNWSLFDVNYMKGQYINISSDIIPVFLAMTIESGGFKDEYVNEYNMNFLRQYEPIGCRDAKTRDLLLDHDVKAYLNGCLTSVTKRRKCCGKKILFVDVPVEVKEYLPHWNDEIEFFTQQQYFDDSYSVDDIRKCVDERYEYYFSEAKLVITSRLHVVSPCMAAGIPVVFTKNVVDARFPWLETYIPLYSQQCYDKIYWTPTVVNYEDNKKKIIEFVVKRIKNCFDSNVSFGNPNEIDSLFKRVDGVYPSFKSTVQNNFKKIETYLVNKYTSNESFSYGIWGIGTAAENFFNYIGEKFPGAKLVSAIDMYKTGEFHGVRITAPYEYVRRNNEIVFVLPVQASNMAGKVLDRLGFSEGEYVCAGDVFVHGTIEWDEDRIDKADFC